MTLTEYLEQDKDRLLADLQNAGDPVRAQAAAGAELDRILFRYNEHCDSDSVGEAASRMMETARIALPLIDTTGDVKVWEQKTAQQSDENGHRLTGMALVFLIAGSILAVVILIMAAGNAGLTPVSILSAVLLLAAALLCTWLSGLLTGNPGQLRRRKKRRRSGKGAKSESTAQKASGGQDLTRTEISVDPQKVYKCLYHILLTIDRNLDEIRSAANWEKRTQAGSGTSLDARTLDLCVSLLEAAASGDAPSHLPSRRTCSTGNWDWGRNIRLRCGLKWFQTGPCQEECPARRASAKRSMMPIQQRWLHRSHPVLPGPDARRKG